jgi:NAD(P)-dependent dehydrogenase (short-subunit alcohol dehydrogenase family)
MAIDIDLSGRIAIVTGAGRGIGRAVALSLAKAGADVCATARNVGEIEQTARMVRETGRRALTVPGDATQSAVAAEVVARTVADLGGLHILVNNAGIELPKPLIETTEDEYNRVMDTNVKSMVLFTQAASPQLIAQHFGLIVNMASVGAFVAAPQSGNLPRQQGCRRASDQGHGDRMGAIWDHRQRRRARLCVDC